MDGSQGNDATNQWLSWKQICCLTQCGYLIPQFFFFFTFHLACCRGSNSDEWAVAKMDLCVLTYWLALCGILQVQWGSLMCGWIRQTWLKNKCLPYMAAITAPISCQRVGVAVLSLWDSEKWGSGTSQDKLMNRWGIFFFFFKCSPHITPVACRGLPGLCNLSLSTSFCKGDSIKITPVAAKESDRGQFDFADWLCAFCFFNSSYSLACHSEAEQRRINCLCSPTNSVRAIWSLE